MDCSGSAPAAWGLCLGASASGARALGGRRVPSGPGSKVPGDGGPGGECMNFGVKD